jgi:hypothetical protein
VSERAWYAVAGGGILVIIGLFALRFPVYLDDFDQWGWQVKCGTGFGGDFAQAAAATNATDFVDRCGTALLVRRLWTIPLVVIGLIAFFGTLLATALVSMREELAAGASGN